MLRAVYDARREERMADRQEGGREDRVSTYLADYTTWLLYIAMLRQGIMTGYDGLLVRFEVHTEP